MFSMAMWMAAIVTPIQIVAGDLHGLNTLEHQPAKIAAIEGHYESTKTAPHSFCLVFPMTRRKEPAMPSRFQSLARWILTHELNGEIKGLKESPADQRPPRLCLHHLSDHGRPRLPDAWRRLWSFGRAGRGSCTTRPCCNRVAVAMGGSGFVLCLRDGTRPRSAVSPGRSMVSCEPRKACRRFQLPQLGPPCSFSSLSTSWSSCRRLLSAEAHATPPTPLDADLELDAGPIRTAGITPVLHRGHRIGDRHAHDLSFIWAGIIAFAVLAYVVLDGFDLGFGFVFPSSEIDATATS